MKGDAFFATMISIEQVEQLIAEKQSTIRVAYTRLSGFTMFCGYFGYWQASIEDVPVEKLEALRDYLQVLAKEPGTFEEHETEDGRSIKLFRVFIYNRSFDPEKYRIGLRYNEDWARLQRQHERHALYDEIGGEGAAIENWRNAELIAPLKYKAPEPYVDEGMGSEQLVTFKWADVCMVVPSRATMGGVVDKSVSFSWVVIGENVESGLHVIKSNGRVDKKMKQE